MTVLRAYLFPTLYITTSEGTPIDLGSPTQRALFAYLLLHRTQPSDRRRLAYLFWPRGTEAAARRNLRQYLHRIRRALEDAGLSPDLITTNGTSVQINPQEQIWLDIETFRHEIRPEALPNELQRAVERYKGDLLSEVYEDWPIEKRKELRQLYLAALQRLIQTAEFAGDFDQAILYLHKYLDCEAYDETVHQQLMQLLVKSQDRSRAIQHYRSLQRKLQEELNTEPLPQTQALFKAIQDGSYQRQPLTPITPEERPIPAQSPPPLALVGRKNELKTLETAFENAQSGQSSFILITGDSGIGKTRLVQEHLEKHPDLPLLQGICHELDIRAPYAPFRYALERAIPLLPPPSEPIPIWLEKLAGFIPALGQYYAIPPSAGFAAHENLSIREIFQRLIVILAQKQPAETPLHIIIDNLHWADSQTWELLAYLTQHPPASPIIIIGLCRLEDLLQENYRPVRALMRTQQMINIQLPRLDEEESAALARAVLKTPAPDDLFFTRLHQETEGNPFFIIETIHAIEEAGHRLGFTPPKDRSNIPAGIQKVIETRLDRLDPESQEMLAAAAVFGREFTFALLGRISDLPDERLIAFLEEWVQRGLVKEVEFGYDFSHDKIRQVAYAGLSRARRQYIHRKAALNLENALPAPNPSILAHHFSLSDTPDKALPYLIEAGEQALQVRSYREARQVGLEAVNLLGRMTGPQQRTERIDLNLQLAQAYAFSNDLDQAQKILATTENLAAALNDESRLGQIFRRSAQIFWLRGQPTAAGDYARRALRVAEEYEDSALLHAALRMLGRVGIALSTFDDAIAYLVRYTNFAQNGYAPASLPIVFGYLGVGYARVGSWSRGFESVQRGVELAIAESAPDTIAFAQMQHAFIHAEYHNWNTVLEILKNIPSHQDGNRPLTPLGFMMLGLHGRALGYLDKPEQGIELIQRALTWAEQTGHRIFHYLPQVFLAECQFHNQQFVQAQATATAALETARDAGNRWTVGYILRLLAEIDTRGPAPDWEKIEIYLIESRDILRTVRARPELARTYLSLRRLYDRAGQIAWAVDCHFRAISIFEELGMQEELRQAQGQAAGNRRGAVVIPNLKLRGPNIEIYAQANS